MRLATVLLVAFWALTGCSREPSTEAQVAGSPAPAPTPDHSRFVFAVDGLITEALKRGGIAGISVAVFQGGDKPTATRASPPPPKHRIPSPR
jgi:hypothetical protein